MNSDGTAINCSINCIVQKHLEISGSVLFITKCKTKWRPRVFIYLVQPSVNKNKLIRTLEDLNWYTKIQRNNKSHSQGVEISSDEVVCEDDTTSTNANTITTTHITTDLDEAMAGQVTGVTVGETIPIQVKSSEAERTISLLLPNDPLSWKNLTEQDKEYIIKSGSPKNPSFPRDSSCRTFLKIFFLRKSQMAKR